MASVISAGTTSGTSLNLSGDTSGVLQLASNGTTTAVTIDTSQNVGIGTASPITKLEVSAANAVLASAGIVQIGSTTAGADVGGQITFRNSDARRAAIAGRQEGSDATAGYLQFGTRGSSGDVTERMRINSSGDIGIGTTSVSSPSGFTKIVQIFDAASSTLVTSGGSRTAEFGCSSSGGWLSANGANPMRFGTDGSERMRIDSSGNVIVSGTSTSSDDATYQGGGVFTSRRASSAGTTHANFLNGGSTVGSITSNTVNTFYNNTSDYRLKENVAPMTGALAKVQQLKPCTYTWKVNGSAGQGFIAHELAEVVPDAVSGEKDAVETYTDEDGNEQTRIKPQGIDTSFLVATLTAAIQELKAELDATKAEVQALKGTL